MTPIYAITRILTVYQYEPITTQSGVIQIRNIGAKSRKPVSRSQVERYETFMQIERMKHKVRSAWLNVNTEVVLTLPDSVVGKCYYNRWDIFCFGTSIPGILDQK